MHTCIRTYIHTYIHIHTLTHTHTHTQAHPVELLCTSDQLVAQSATHTTHYKHKRRTSMPLGGVRTREPSNRADSILGPRDRLGNERLIEFIGEVKKL